MRDAEILLNPNRLVQHLKKPAAEFTKYDIIRFVEDEGVKMLNLRYVGEDGKLKTLNFVITGKAHLNVILSTGERVDGSSLFSYIEAGRSDLYIIPRYSTAFLNPFSEVPTLDILCSFYTSDGEPLASSPEYILRKAHRTFKAATGYRIKALGELEYYVIGQKGNLYPIENQRGYHESSPFTNWEHLRTEALILISQTGAKIKYGHSEVGNFTTEDKEYEQHEIEFNPVPIEQAADQLVISKWILRMLGKKYGVDISFAPKITVGKAGSGMHIHLMLEKEGKSVMIQDYKLSAIAKKAIVGMLNLAEALTAFGNTNPTSYLRLVPHQEAPTNVCWGDSNRSVLVRVPLGWVAPTEMVKDANPQQFKPIPYVEGKQTIEFRAPDGSADVYHLLAGLTVAIQHGLEMENALEIAEKLYVDVNIFDETNQEKLESLRHLPQSCWQSAEKLEEYRAYFERNDVFPSGTINRLITKLKSFNDKELSEELYQKDHEISLLVNKYLHWM